MTPDDPVGLLAILKQPVRPARPRPRGPVAQPAPSWSALRGPRLEAPGWIEARLAEAGRPRDGQPVSPERLAGLAEAADLLRRLQAALALAAAPFADGQAATPDAARGLATAMEALAAGPDGAPGELWAGPDGEAAVGLLTALIGEGEGLPPASPLGFSTLLEGLLGGETVRTARATHPRLQILGALESRLVSADRLVLAGLEEGVWPQAAPTDPFLSRPMRAAFGLPPPERRIGLSAHDFAQAACAPEVGAAARRAAGRARRRWSRAGCGGCAPWRAAPGWSWRRGRSWRAGPRRWTIRTDTTPPPRRGRRPRWRTGRAGWPSPASRPGCATPTPSMPATCSACAGWTGPASRWGRRRAAPRSTRRSTASPKPGPRPCRPTPPPCSSACSWRSWSGPARRRPT